MGEALTLPRGNQIGAEGTRGTKSANREVDLAASCHAVPSRQVWRTGDVAKHESFSYFCEAVCEAFMELSPSKTSSLPFYATVESVRLPRGRVNTVRASSHSVEHRSHHIRRKSKSCYYLNLQMKSQSTIIQGSRVFILKPGQMALFDGERPFEVHHPKDREMAVASFQVPKQLVEDVARENSLELGQVGRRQVSDHATLGTLATATAYTLANQSLSRRALDTQAMFDSLIRLGVAASADVQDELAWANAARGPALFATILSYLEQNLRDPELSVSSVSKHFSISTRYLHKLFDNGGPSFSEYVHNRRLDLAIAQIRNPKFFDAGIAEIAFGCGFSDLSTFNRRFKSKFGISPSGVRLSRSPRRN